MTAPVLTPRPAATTMVLRDGPTGLEVLLLLRSDRSVFVPGAHVFPGGAVEAADHLSRRARPREPPIAEFDRGRETARSLRADCP